MRKRAKEILTRNDKIKYYLCGMGSFEYMHNTWVIFILMRVVERRWQRGRRFVSMVERRKKLKLALLVGEKNGQYQPGLDLNVASELV